MMEIREGTIMLRTRISGFFVLLFLTCLPTFGLIRTSAVHARGPLFPGAQYTVGSAPVSVAIGDLDGDQVPDLAVANTVSDNVSVLLGLGDGMFAAAVHYSAGDGPYSVAIGDLDGDQVPDLAVANYNSDDVSVLLGLGDGTFAAAADHPVGDWPCSVAISDLDGDQVLDLAVANYRSDTVSVLLGSGDGTFSTAVDYRVGDEPRSVAIADLDGDMVPDLAVANRHSDNVSVLLGVGNGTFAAAARYAAGSIPQSVAIGDLDGDRMLDLAVANRAGDSVSVLLNQSRDCNVNGIPDERDIEDGTSQDCNENHIPDECDIADGTSADENEDGIPDECPIIAKLDIKPGSCPNPVNPRSKGVVPMAIVGSDSFDVTQIDAGTLTLRRADGVGSVATPLSGPPGPRITIDDVATPFAGDLCDCHDLGGDGIDDLLLKFSTPELAGAFQLSKVRSGAPIMLTLSGSLLDGTAFRASDCVVIPGNAAPPRKRGPRERE